MYDKKVGVAELGGGGILMSVPVWTPFLDGFVNGAHIVASLAGAIIGVHGVYRILNGRRNRP